MCYRRQFLRKIWPIQLAFRHFIVSTVFLSLLNVCNTFSFLIRNDCLQYHLSKLSRYFWSTLRSVQVSTPAPKLFYKSIILLVFSINLNSISAEKISLLVEFCIGHSSPLFNFSCTYFIICYCATKIFEIFYILQFFSIINCSLNGFIRILTTLVFYLHWVIFCDSSQSCLLLPIFLSISTNHLHISQWEILLLLFWILQTLQELCFILFPRQDF
jgi:hypothetical protein